MFCNFHAFTSMQNHRLAGLLLICAALSIGSVRAQALSQADRDAPLSFDAGQMRIDSKRKVRMLTGGVEITKGSFWMKAAEVELREQPQGDLAIAYGAKGQLAAFRQRRDAFDEVIDGQAERIEYDQRTEVVRLIGKAVLKRWRGGVLAEEVTGQTAAYDRVRETFEVQGGADGSGGGRVRGVVTPSSPAGGAGQRPAPVPGRPSGGDGR